MKIVLLTDIHFGEKGNSEDFNQSAIAFLEFVRNTVKAKYSPADTRLVFLGDLLHQRNQVNVKTLQYSQRGLELMASIGEHSYILLGNHDLYYHDKRDVSSIMRPATVSPDKMTIIDRPQMVNIGDSKCLLCPWLIGDEHLPTLLKTNAPDYTFGHFELPSFYLNKAVQMKGDFDAFEYSNSKRIISGHYHTRQEKGNIVYLGNCFSHNFADANDWMNKGFGVLDTDTNQIEYFEWAGAPKYLKVDLSNLGKLQPYLNPTVHLMVVNDKGVTPDTLNKLFSVITEEYGVSDIIAISPELNTVEQTVESMEHIEDINILITSLISEMEFLNISTDRLVEIYNQLGKN